MENSFDEAYAKYLESLAKLDETDDIAEKNKLFRELAILLSEMEKTIRPASAPSEAEASVNHSPEPTYWI